MPEQPDRDTQVLQVQQTVLERSVAVIFQNARRALIANGFLATLLVISNQAARASVMPRFWVLSVLAAFGARLWLANRFFELSPVERRTRLPRFRRFAIASATLSGLVWGVGLAMFWQLASPREQLLLTMVITGLVPAAASTLSAIPKAFLGYLLPVWLVIVGSLLADASEPADVVIVAAAVALLPALLRSVRGMHDEFARTTRMALDLERARDVALAAAGARSEFLAVMSHELRTPLNGVVGLTSLLLDTHLDTEQKELAKGANESGQMLLGLVNNILDLSKIDAGHIEFENKPFSLAHEIESLHALFELRATERQLAFTISVADDVPPWVVGDWFRLRQVLVNLVGNALKFTERGEVACRVRTTLVTSSAATLRFDIQDQGQGMNAEQLARLFQPFTQGDSSITRRYGGTGLGLAISKRLVELMGGALRVESTVGQGSTFWFEVTLPRCEAPTVVLPPTPPPVSSTAPRRVLVCDDNEINLKVATRILEKHGFAVEVRRNGVEALKALEVLDFDAVLMDLQMPVMDGFEALRLARSPAATVRSKDLPFIALTASASVTERLACEAAGFDGFLTKPVEPKQLVRTLALVCRDGRAGPRAG